MAPFDMTPDRRRGRGCALNKPPLFFSPAVLVLPSKMFLFGHFGGSNAYEICLILAVRIPMKLELLWLGFNYVQAQVISQISGLEVEGGVSFIGGA